MNKNIPILILAALAILLGAASVYEFVQVKNLKSELQMEVEGRRADNLHSSNTNEELTKKNSVLSHNQIVMRDSLRMLDVDIRKLKRQIRQQRALIDELEEQMKRKEVILDSIQTLLAQERSLGRSSRSRIAELEKAKSEMDGELGSLTNRNDSLLVEKNKLVDEMLDREAQEDIYKKRISIINNSYALFQTLILKDDKKGKAIKKLKKKKNNWHYTAMTFNLNHENENLLLGEEFVLKIVDKETNQAISLREENPQEGGGKDANGVVFTFESNPVELIHVNWQKKEGENYEVQLYYRSGKEEFLLKNGTQLIMSKGKPLHIGI